MRNFVVLGVVFALLTPFVMGAGEIIDIQATANDRVGFSTDSGWIEAFTTFTASATYYVQDIETVMCRYNNNVASGSFNMNLYTVSGGLPDTVIASSGSYTKSQINCTTTGTPNPATDWQRFSLSEAVQLTSGTDYAIVFNNTNSGLDERIQWGFNNAENTHQIGNCVSGCYTLIYTDQATFRTTNATPPAPPTPSDFVNFIPPTPPSGSNNNTLVRFAWNTSTNRSDFYWRTQGGSFAKYLDNVTNNNATYAFTANVTTDGTYEYFATLPGDNSTNTTIYEWTYDTTEPPINLGANNSFNATNQTINIWSDYLVLNVDVTDNIDLFAFHINVTYQNGTSYFAYTNSTLSGTSYNYYNNITTTAYPLGNYTVNILASDSHTANRIGDYRPKKITSGLEFDTEEGNRVFFWAEDTAVMNASKCEEDRYCFDVNFTDGREKKRKFFVQSDASIYYKGDDSGYLGHFVISKDGIGGNWLDVEGVNTTATVTRLNSSMYSIELAKIKDKVRFHSLGGLNVNEKHYLWQKSSFSLNSVSITPVEASTNDDLQGFCRADENFTNPVDYSFRWYLNDVLNTSGSASSQTPNIATLLSNISSASTSQGQNWTFSCQASTTYNGYTNTLAWTNSSQTSILSVILSLCQGSTQYPVLNMSYFDEVSGSSITADNGIDLAFYDGFDYYNNTISFTGNASDSLCTNINPANTTYSWLMWGTLNVQKTNYATRLLSFSESLPINVSNNPTYEFPINLIQLNDSTTVNYQWLTKTFQPIDGIWKIYKCELDGTKTLVESATISAGSATANIELLNTPYSYSVEIGSNVYLDDTGYSACHIESLTERTFFVDTLTLDSDGLSIYNIECDLNVSGLNVNMNWSDNPANADPITGCVQAYRKDVFNNTLVYESCTSSSNSLSAVVTNNSFSYFITGSVTQSGYQIQCGEGQWVNTSTPAGSQIGMTGLFGMILIVMALVLVYASSGTISIVGAIIGLVAGFVLTLGQMNPAILSASISILLIVGLVARYSKKNG